MEPVFVFQLKGGAHIIRWPTYRVAASQVELLVWVDRRVLQLWRHQERAGEKERERDGEARRERQREREQDRERER